MAQVIVVGAGLGGLRAAESLRAQGFDVMVIGEEIHLPYNRPPLSKEALKGGVEIEAVAETTAQTGVEMEALTAVSVACLTIYDMVKAVEREMQITDIRLILKDGGKSGLYEATL